MSRTTVEEIKARIPIEDLVGSYVKIDRAGKSYKARCPFHNEKSASFFISPERGGYYCFGCFPPGQLIRTPFGYHAIETLDTKHHVYSGKGNIRKILATQYREYHGQMISVDVQKLGGTVSLTSDHNLPIIRPKTKYYKNTKQFYRQVCGYKRNTAHNIRLSREQIEKHATVLKIPAGELRVGDFVMYPIPTAVSNIDKIDLSTYLEKKHKKGPIVRAVSYKIQLSDDFLKLIGYYIAEGSNSRAYIRFSLGDHEEDFAREIVSIVKDTFGLDAKIHKRTNKNGIEVTVCHAYLANIFANLCGKGSENKHIPFAFQELPVSKQMVLVHAINRGDGHSFKPLLSNHIHNTITVVSRILVEQIADILLRNDIFPSVHSRKKRIDKKGVNHKETYSVKWSSTAIARHEVVYLDDGARYWLLPVKRVRSETYSGPVYNFTVDEDHTYATKNFAVSNCGAKGDIFNFVEQFEGLDFKGALKVLAEKAGVPLIVNHKDEGERDQLFRIMEDSAKFFEDQFAKSKEAGEYVKGRGITAETREVFRIGWAPEGWNHLHDYLKKKGWSQAVMEKAGLIKRKEGLGDRVEGITERFYDRFRGRVMFPISDSSGRIVAFTGRILKADDRSAKYMNSPDTLLYDKSSILFGLDKSKAEIRRQNYTVMVEGQMDLIMSYQAGVRNIVAASGTALSDESVNKQGAVNNLGLIRRLSPNVIIAFDSDNAGRKAAFRAAGIALSLGMDVKMADIVGGKDPADLVKENPEIWKEILRTTKPVVEFELSNVLRDETDPRKIPRALRERVFPLLASIESRTDQDYFVKMIADKASIDAGAIWEDLRTVRKKMEGEAAAVQKSAHPFGGSSSSPQTLQGGNGRETPSKGGATDSLDNQAAAKESVGGSQSSQSGASSRNDLVERRMFGLLNLMKDEDPKKHAEYMAEIEKIAGAKFQEKIDRASHEIGDMSFEAEAMYGSDKDKWDVHIRELIINFGLDIVNDELIQTMRELRIAEKAGDHARVAELAKKCQVLSIRKAEVAHSRRH